MRRQQEENMIKIAIMGYGTIGSGVYEVLEQNQDVIAADVGQEIQVKYILDLRDFPRHAGGTQNHPRFFRNC